MEVSVVFVGVLSLSPCFCYRWMFVCSFIRYYRTLAKQIAKENASKNTTHQTPLPRVAFSKDTSSEVMFEHSLKEHPVACEELVRCSAAKLFEMKARLH